MSLLTEADKKQLLENGNVENREEDHFPVVSLFMEDAQARWLLTELDPDQPDIAFGLCDLGYPELGYVSLQELESIGGKLGLPVIRDAHFEAKYPISVYARAARLAQEITHDERLLSLAVDDAENTASNPPKPKPPQP
jgi:hypothetical protein